MEARVPSTQDLADIIQSIPTEEQKHMQRVGELTCELLHILLRYKRFKNFNSNFSHFGNYAFYHDIGKAWVPADILAKEDPLTFEEFETVTMHPLYAKEYFDKNPNVLNLAPLLKHDIVDAAVYHHERWDGKGYPYGLSSHNIPLIARVTSVCDAYDAITHHRPYSKARSHEDALEEIAKHAAEQFDPEIALVFIENEREIRIVYDRQSKKKGGAE